MPLIPEHVIDEIQMRMDIAELIGRYVPLKRAGRHFKGLCPFHKEKTPSFMVNTDKQIFHCFGCGVGGNIFSFLVQHDRLTFPEAVRQLAEHVGVPVPDRETGSSNGTHEKLAALMEKTCAYFEHTLAHVEQGKAARAYLTQRGVSSTAVTAFRLGWAPAGWDRLLTAVKASRISPEALEAAGLVLKGRRGYYDRFRSRLIFPIEDARGRVVGFGGRSLDGQEPKYLNSPETALYTKGRHLFGLAQAREAIVKTKCAVVVEGYFDCVVLSEGGILNVVSPLGTALTIEQARLLKRYAEEVILGFDADTAGEDATLRGIDLLVEAGLRVRVVQLPAGQDPDECLRSLGLERFQQLLAEAVSIFEFLIDSARRRFPARTTEDKVRAAQFILPTIAKVPDAMLRSEYVRLLAERLRLDEEAVAKELEKARPRGNAVAFADNRQRSMTATGAQSTAPGPERLLTALVLDEPSRWERVQAAMSLDGVTDPALHRILGVVGELVTTRRDATPAQVVSRLSDEGQGALVSELVAFAQSVSAKEAAFEDCVRRLRVNARQRHLAELREALHAAQTAGQEQQVRRLLAEYSREVKGG